MPLTEGDEHRCRGPAAACAGCGGTFSIARCIALLSCGYGSRCASRETDSLNCSTIACHMAAAQFFSVFLRCEVTRERLGPPKKAGVPSTAVVRAMLSPAALKR
jgi:hypothetical protein